MSDLDDKLKQLVMRHGWITENDDWQQAVMDIKQAFADEGYRLTRGMKEGRMVAVPAGEWHDYKATKRMAGQEWYDKWDKAFDEIHASSEAKYMTERGMGIEAAKRASGIPPSTHDV